MGVLRQKWGTRPPLYKGVERMASTAGASEESFGGFGGSQYCITLINNTVSNVRAHERVVFERALGLREMNVNRERRRRERRKFWRFLVANGPKLP